MAEASVFNDSHKIGLFHGAGTPVATWFDVIHRLLRLKKALKATVYGAAFESVSKNALVVLAIADIKDEILWKGVFYVLKEVFPELKASRYCNSRFQPWIKYTFL